MERWGHPHNFCKENPSRLAWEKKLLETEGITNVFQREEVKGKIKETILTKYGVESSACILTSRGKNSYSKLHREVVKELQDLGLTFGIEKKVQKTKGHYWAFDIFFEPNKLVEVNGDYWHGNPKIYKATDLWLKGSSREQTMQVRWDWDKEKTSAAQAAGFKVLTVWESDWKQDKTKELIRIQEFINEDSKDQVNQEDPKKGSL